MNDARPPQKPAAAPGKRIALVLAIAMHLLLAGFLIYGVHWQTKAPDAVEVELVTAPPVAVPPAPTFEPEPTPPKPEPRPEPRPEPKPEPKPAPPLPKPDIAVKEPVKKPPPPKVPEKVPEKALPKEPVKETPKPLLPDFRQADQELRNRKASDAAAREVAEHKAAQAAADQSKGAANWGASISKKLRRNIVLPPDIKGNPEAIFDVALLPCVKEGCDIISVRLKKSTGNTSLDAAIERAILKSSPLPKPEQGGVFRRDLELKFRPMEPEQL